MRLSTGESVLRKIAATASDVCVRVCVWASAGRENVYTFLKDAVADNNDINKINK